MAEVYRARLTGKGQVQVPKAVREALGAGRGDDLVFRVEESGAVYVALEPKKSLSELAGILGPREGHRSGRAGRELPPDEEAVAAREATERDLRVVREYQGTGAELGGQKER